MGRSRLQSVSQFRHLPRSWDLDFERRMAESRIALWTAEVEAGRRSMTRALADAIQAEEQRIRRLQAELSGDGNSPGLDLAGAVPPAGAGQAVKQGAAQERGGCFPA